jgi:hypothetical protein
VGGPGLVSRRSVAEAPVTVAIALTAKGEGRSGGQGAAAGIVRLGVQPCYPREGPLGEIAAALGWVARASLPVSALGDPATVRLALGVCARTLARKAAAGSPQRRKRSVFYNALGYAVGQGHLASNPVDRIQWAAPAVAQSVDRWVVVSPAQARNCWPPSADCPTGERTWRRSTPTCTMPRCTSSGCSAPTSGHGRRR